MRVRKVLAVLVLVLAAMGVLTSPAFGAASLVAQPNAGYLATTHKVDITTASLGSTMTSVASDDLVVYFNQAMTRRQIGAGWATWSAPPSSESSVPPVLVSAIPSLTIDLSRPVTTFGFELEPNANNPSVVVAFKVLNGGTTVGTFNQTVNWSAGARLCAITSDEPFTRVEVSAGAETFAIAQIRYSTARRYDFSTPIAISDLSTATAKFAVSGPDGPIKRVWLSFHLTHTFTGDCDISLVSPDGTVIDLSSDNGGTGDNYGLSSSPEASRTVLVDDATVSIVAGVAPFVGAYRPESAFAAFSGMGGSKVNGTWTLRVYDDTAVDTGSLVAASLYIENDWNTGPALASILDTAVAPLSTVTYQASAVDLEGDAIEYSVNGPAGASISPQGLFIWTPSVAQAGAAYPVTVYASDGSRVKSTAFHVYVQDVNANVTSVAKSTGTWNKAWSVARLSPSYTKLTLSSSKSSVVLTPAAESPKSTVYMKVGSGAWTAVSSLKVTLRHYQSKSVYIKCVPEAGALFQKTYRIVVYRR